MYMICYTDSNGNNTWEIIDGEDAMQERVSCLIDEVVCDAEDIMVFNMDDEVK